MIQLFYLYHNRKLKIMEKTCMENGCFLYFTFEKNNWPLDIISYMDTLLINTESKHVALKNDATSNFLNYLKK